MNRAPEARARARRLVALALALLPACGRKHDDRAPHADAAATVRRDAGSQAVGASSASPHPATLPHPAPTAVNGCRVLGVRGTTSGVVPGVGELLTGAAWLDLPASIELSLKHTETTRELSLIGPGRFLACPAGKESVVVARGTVSTTPGPGARAGAEVELATPLGLVHYSDAKLRLEVSDKALTLEVEQGAAALLPSQRAGKPSEGTSVHAPKGHAKVEGRADAAALASECRQAEARISEQQSSAGAAVGSARGAWAASMFEARRASRFACSIALAASGIAPRGPLDLELKALAIP